jgi:hypothetical protein
LQSKNVSKKINPWLSSLLILPITIYFTLNAGKFTFIDYLNLLIHEGGHGIFSFFGKFIYTLGGSLMQIIIPAMFVIFYWIKKKRFLVQIFLVWLGENLMNISVYVSDARTKQLPLLGGNKVYHDWNYLLSNLNLLEYDESIGKVIFICGTIMFVVALFIPLLIKDYQTKELDINL